MSNFNFQSVQDVAARLNGFSEWDFGGGADFDGFCLFVALNHNNEKYAFYANNEDRQGNQLMRDYLISMGENPSNYDL